jgi:phosphoribosylformylglycinamidine synthase
MFGAMWGFPPALDLTGEAALQRAVIQMIDAGLLDSAHDCSQGGLAVALAECGFQKGIGCKIELASNELPAEYVLFGEDASRIVVSCDSNHLARIKQIAAQQGIFVDLLGQTQDEFAEIRLDGRAVVSSAISALKRSHEDALPDILHSEPEIPVTN